MPDTHLAARPVTTTLQILRRDGRPASFDPGKISRAMTKAFLAVEGASAAASHRIHEVVEELTEQVVAALTRHGTQTLHIEDIQDQVELALMRNGHHKVARAYVLYREDRKRERAAAAQVPAAPVLHVRGADGTLRPLDEA
ncbi:ATP cone domain-containing protein, partial [Teichococcus wenyumeiae]